MSDEDYEDLVVEALYLGEFCFLLSQEEGRENLRVAIHPRGDGKPWEFHVKDLQLALEKGAHVLWQLRKVEE